MSGFKFSKFFGRQKIPRIPLRYSIVPLAVVGFVVVSSISIDTWQYDLSNVQRISTVFLSIIMQVFPFLMGGALLSSCIHELIPDRWTDGFVKRRGFLSIPAAVIAAFLFPVCDCASVPVAARFARKGFPVQSVVTFMLAAPIINPIVIVSTWYAFPDYTIVGVRIVLGIIIPVLLGIAAQFIFRSSSSIVAAQQADHNSSCSCAGFAPAECDHQTHGVFNRIVTIMIHTGSELVSVMPYVILGAVLSSLMQVYISPGIFSGNIAGLFLQTVVMVGFAFLLSVCSTSDAFFARSFLSHVSMGPAVGFMTAGPMIDAKNVLMMSGYFRKRFIIFIAVGVMVLVFVSVFVLSLMVFGAQ
jgi:uncharacterized membrane protein YraQ (UPF0718 family)